MPIARAVPFPQEHRASVLLTRFGALGVLWVSLVEAEPRGVALGMMVLPLIAWGSLALERPGTAHVCPLELMRLLPHCAGLALRGGLEVARHALCLKPPARSGRIVVRSRLPRGPARSFLHAAASLVPGLFVVESWGDELTLHLLDASPGPSRVALARVRELEERVARLFGLIPPPRGLS